MMKIMTYGEWCTSQENFYEVMPLWYHQEYMRRARYDAYRKTAKERAGQASATRTRCPECGAIQATDDTE